MIAPFERAKELFRGLIQSIIQPESPEVIWQFLERVVRVPGIAGSRVRGPLKTGLMPIWRGLLEKYANPRVRYFTLCKAARIGGTMFFGICLVIEKVLRWPGPIGWLDPTRKTAAFVSRTEIQPYLKACKETDAVRAKDKKMWTTLEMFFQSCKLTILGAGSINDLGGRQFELGILNEQDRIPNRQDDGPTPSQEMEARSSQFEDTRKIVRNSTPFRESGLTWGEFLAGSQHHGYVPCPHCHAYQRLTFFAEPAEPDRWMRIDDDDPVLIGHEIPRSDRHGIELQADSRRDDYKLKRDSRGWMMKGIPGTGRVWWSPEAKDRKANRWDADKVAATARYECVYCKARIRPEELARACEKYTLRGHNRFAPRDHISAHVNALYSPWQSLGQIAKQFITAMGILAKQHAFHNLILGLPFISSPTSLTPKHIALIQEDSAKVNVRYHRQYPDVEESELTLHVRPVCLTMQADVQQTEFWWTIRALCEDGSRHLLAWGNCGTFAELDKMAGRTWAFDHGESAPAEFRYERFSCYDAGGWGLSVVSCIIDTGYKAKRPSGVYEFLYDMGGKWIGVKGGAFTALGAEKPIIEKQIEHNYPGVGTITVTVAQCNDFIMQGHFSRSVLKERKKPQYHLPQTLDEHLINHLTSPRLTKKRLGDGRMEDVWQYDCDPHLYDCEKYGEVICLLMPPADLQLIRAEQDKLRQKAIAKLSEKKS